MIPEAAKHSVPPCFVASLDMRTKICVSVAAASSAIFLDDWRLLACVNALTFLYVLNLRRLKPVAAMYAATALMLGVAFCFIPVFAQLLKALAVVLPAGTGEGFRRLADVLGEQAFSTVLLPFLRISVSMNVFLALGLTFDNQEFISVMRKLRLPRIVFIPLMVCCRFVPSFVNDIRQLYESLRIRRKNMSFFTLLASPVRFLRFLVVPVCVRTLRIADDLVMMCEVRRVGYRDRCVCAAEHKLRSRDLAVIAFAFCTAAALVSADALFGDTGNTFMH